jgi:hypothetical protein
MWEPPLLILSRRLNQRLAGIHVRYTSAANIAEPINLSA